jgi:tetratricopeptide (TPR) repeat protein
LLESLRRWLVRGGRWTDLPEWLPVALVCALALALRLVYVWQVGDSSLVAPEDLDPGLYYNWAKEIAAGSWLGKDPFVQSPLYAYLLGVLMMVIGSGVTRILVTQAFVGCGTVLLTYLAGRRLFDHRRGLLAALLITLYAPFIFFEGMVMKTFLSPFLTVLLILMLDRAREAVPGRAGAAGLFALAGVVYGLTTLDRDNFILLAPALALLVLWIGGGVNRKGWMAAGAFTLGTVLVITPVTLRNWLVSHEFVLLTTGGGEVFFIGNNADANGLYVPPPFVRPDPKYEHADFAARASEIEGRRLSPMQSSWFWFQQGAKFIAEEPLAWVRLLWRKMVYFWNFFELPDNLDFQVLQEFSPLLDSLVADAPPRGWPTLLIPGGGRWRQVRLHLYSSFGTVAPLGLLGIYLTRRRWLRLLPLHVLLFGYMATVLLFFNFARFRVPVVPILALFASESLVRMYGVLKRAWGLGVAFLIRSGDMVSRAQALRPGVEQSVACVLLALIFVGVNIEHPRGVVPAIEQALITGNAYYDENEPEQALRSYWCGLLLLGEGASGGTWEQEMRRCGYGSGVSRDLLASELEVEAVARGPQFKGIHLGIHHGIGIAMVQKATVMLDRGERQAALALLDRAIAQFEEALKLAPAYLLSIRKMARAYSLKGDNASAIEWLTKGTDLWPEDLSTRLDLEKLLFDNGELMPALRQLEDARTYNKNLDLRQQAQIYGRRGEIFLGLNELGRALFNFERAIELDPTHPQADDIRRAILELRSKGYQPQPDDVPRTPSPTPGASIEDLKATIG